MKLALGLASAGMSIAVLLLVGRVVSFSGSGFTDRVGMSYTAFALSGVVVHGLGMASLGAFRRAVRREQLQGTFEQLLASGRHPVTVVALAGGAELFVQSIAYAALAAGGLALAGLERLPGAAVGAAAAYVVGMLGLGLASAGATIVFKEGEPIGWAFGVLSGIVGGVIFPTFLLPDWLLAVSRWIPTTRALEVVRTVVTGGATDVAELLPLLGFAVGSVALGVVALNRAVARAKRTGTVARY